MSADRRIPDAVIRRQVDASDPATSAFVSANAGSGKTHVLAQRVIRLLLQGFDPAKILCITFTKAAAANMANRVFDELRKWTALDDAELDEAVRRISNRKPDAGLRARARRLFALALETPGGLKVQTIHAFCTSLLHLFPFEANVSARFTVLDEATQNQLLDQLTLKLLLEASAAPDGSLGRALAQAIATAADVTFRDVLAEAIRERDRLTRWIDAAGGADKAIAQLSQALGIEPADNDDAVNAAFFNGEVISPSEWASIGTALKQGSKNDNAQGDRFLALAGLTESERPSAYIEIFCTKSDLSPRKNIVTKTIRDNYPELAQRLVAEQNRVCELIARRRALAVRDRSAGLIAIAHAVLELYRAEKDRRGLLDYDDLIDKTLDLLGEVSSAWVHYKLDRGIDHVLIDEAQDTSPKQWAIVRALVAEFFAGQGAHARPRTIYAVGDEKQSIFSFQGAAPHAFDDMRREFERLSRAAELEFRHVQFTHSFRSGPNVLTAVDQVFAERAVFTSITTDEAGVPEHLALPDAAPGLVEIWDTEKPDPKDDAKEGWDAPFDETTETSPPVKLARRIARHVLLWQQRGHKPGDVLILVRRRGALFEAIIRALKNEGIAVAGADRLVLTDHIAVMDLMALADALLLPDDDLALATVLKSPLFGLDDDALFALAWNREGSLRAALRAQRPDVAGRLDALDVAARKQSPFAFYAELLGNGTRRKILARLGHEAADALDEFLNLALDYERGAAPSLQGFVAWLRAAKSEVKRDMEIARDEVRVMTVHGAKGLEAPIVILADTTTPPQGWHAARLLAIPPTNAPPAAPDRLVWAGSKTNDVGPMAAAREAANAAGRDEYRRLLYVAMTRASERLIVCGVDGTRKRPEGCWYDLVRGALEPNCISEPADDSAGDVLRFRKVPEVEAKAPPETPSARHPIVLPDWLKCEVKPEPERPKPIAPSTFADDEHAAELLQPGTARQRALLRGTIVHRLMQSLPDVPAADRADKTRRFLARQGELSDSDRDEIAKQVLALLAEPRFAPLFAPGSRAEVSIAGRIGGRTLSGQVDRLVVTPNEVLIADYKTNRPAPRALAEVQARHGSYVAQLALYRAVLMRLYPGRPVRAALLWTDTPELMEIPAGLMDSALNKPVAAA
jgi:ATP-dependent helicase/nuclease subunit A